MQKYPLQYLYAYVPKVTQKTIWSMGKAHIKGYYLNQFKIHHIFLFLVS